MAMKLKILIVNEPQIQVTEGIRTLKDNGYDIDIAIPSKDTFKAKVKSWFLSKFIDKHYFISSPFDSDNFMYDLQKILREQNYDVILPFGFETTVAISKIKEQLEDLTNMCIADFETLIKVHDKENLNLLLAKNEFDVPKIYEYNSFDRLCEQELQYPLVVKARRGCGMDKGVRYASNLVELKNAYFEISDNSSDNTELSDFSRPLIQEYIPGKIYDGLFLCDQGEVKLEMAQIREVSYPLSGGVGVNNISLEDEDLLRYCRDILEFIKWHGPCQVEVKKDSRSGKYKLIEINPKLWGTLGLSIKSGVNFPVDSCRLAVGENLEYTNQYKKNIKYKILFPLEIFTIVQDKGNRWHRFKKLFEIFEGNTVTDFDKRDLKPNIIYILYTFFVLLFNRKKILPKGKEYQ